jgi:hypothetical protein
MTFCTGSLKIEQTIEDIRIADDAVDGCMALVTGTHRLDCTDLASMGLVLVPTIDLFCLRPYLGSTLRKN